LKKDKSIIVNILQSTIADLEKSKQKIEASNIKLIEHQNELNTQKKIIENKSQKLRDNLKKLEHSYNELEEFTHIASHDLKSPLRSISGFAYLLQKKYKKPN
jgi:signal transduction histidine kinase